MNLKERARALKRELAALFLAYRHPDTPKRAKWILAITLCYALSPIDLVPDFIPVLGYLDDLLILPALIAWSTRLIPTAIMEECRAQAADMWQHGRPKQAKFAIPIIVFWMLCLAVIARYLVY